ncbi:MAG TPA: hypothetical protein P5338_13220, partial [Bacteroidales bacterium]|nr:hypothetical protein [Bacteroidales bacterium]
MSRKSILLPLFVLLWHVSSVSQPLSGTYTVGGTGASYPDPAAAAAAVTSNGVSGPVTFVIAPGTYTGNMTVGPVQGTSATNKVIFESSGTDSSAVIITFPASTSATTNYALRLNGASHVSFRYLTFQRTGSNDYSQVVDIINGCTYIHFYHNRFISTNSTTSATYKSVVYSPNASSQSNLTFEGNRFENGSYGIFHLGISQLICCIDQGIKIMDNQFFQPGYAGIALSYCSGPQITGNLVESSSATAGYGIYTFFCDNNLRILKNRVFVTNDKGICVHNATIAGIPINLIANNFISVGGTAASEGILIDNSKSCHIYYNSVNLHNTNAGSSAFKVNGINSGLNELYNNLLVNTGGGYSLNATTSTATPFNSSNYNNFFTTGTQTAFWQSAGNLTSLSAYQTASLQDMNSVATDPQYTSISDLHCNNSAINNIGTPSINSATPVIDDIDGELRSPATPDMGADEFLIQDLAMMAIDTIQSLCANGIPNIRVMVLNKRNLAFNDSVSFYFGFAGQIYQNTKQLLQILPLDTAGVFLTGSLPLPAAGLTSLTVYMYCPEDAIRQNDTLAVSATIGAPFTFSLGPDMSLCGNEIKLVTAMASGASITWHDQSQGSTWQADGALLGPGTFTVWAIAENPQGCLSADSIFVTVNPVPSPSIMADLWYKAFIGNDSVTVICTKLLTTFSGGNFQSYQWYLNGIPVSTNPQLWFQPDFL